MTFQKLMTIALVLAPLGNAELDPVGLKPELLAPASEMQATVDKVLSMTGLHNDVRVVLDPQTKTCAWAATVNGQQYIGVNVTCTGPLRINGEYNWACLGALMHELGHLLNGATTSGKHSHDDEIFADEWAGWAMARLGASLREAESIFRTFSEEASTTHPGRADRLEAVARGWAKGHADRIADPNIGPTPSPAPPDPPKAPGGWLDLLNRKLPWATGE